jgi:NADP-dependent 3-hydroxy acid dehydrogenase YdfG
MTQSREPRFIDPAHAVAYSDSVPLSLESAFMPQLEGKVAVVTGGGSGIGSASAATLFHAGAKVAIVGRDQAKLDQVAKTLGSNDRVLACSADIADVKQVKAMAEKVTKQLGPIDILVNNAGTNLKHRTFQELTPEAWDRLIRTNLDGAFYCMHAIVPGMQARKDGVVVNIVSIAGLRAGALGGVAYAASKFGMHALGIALADEMRNSGIRVCNIYPGEVDTPILEFRPQAVTDEHRHRILRPEDIAAGVLYAVTQPPNVSIPELVIKPTWQSYV